MKMASVNDENKLLHTKNYVSTIALLTSEWHRILNAFQRCG